MPLMRRAAVALALTAHVLFGAIAASAQDLGVRLALGESTRFDLPVSLDRIYWAGQDLVIGLRREDRVMFLIDGNTGKILSDQPFDGIPLQVVPFAISDGFGPPIAAVLIERGSGDRIIRRFAFTPKRGIAPLDLPEVIVPEEFREPGMAFVPFGKGAAAEAAALVVWDGAATPGTDEYLFVWDFKQQSIRTKNYPQFIVPFGSDNWVLTLNPNFERASIIELPGGERFDNVLVERLGFESPEQFDVFTPGAIFGGSENILIANGSSRRLIALSVQFGYTPLIDPPLQISLDGFPTDRAGRFMPWVVADRELSMILVGAVGADEAHVFRRIRGGIGAYGTLSLDMPVLDATVLHRTSGLDSERFAFLSPNGRQLMIVEAGGFQPVEEAMIASAPERGLVLTAIDADDIARVQRVLAAFGYTVGAIDGIVGPQTTTAVRAFQFDNGLEPNGQLTEQTLTFLNTSLTETTNRSSVDRMIRAYANFMADVGVPRVDAGQLMTLGISQEDPDHPCFALNSPPAENLWPFSVKFAHIFERLTNDFNLDIQIVSGYRSPAYNRCLREEQFPMHETFAAFDIRLADTENLNSGARRIEAALDRLEAGGHTTIRVQKKDNAIHLVPRIGQWHAQIATYGQNPRGCEFARSDVDEFARLLAGSEVAGREILVSRVMKPENFVVTIDTNNDEAAARTAVRLVREMSPKSQDHRTGSDAFVQENNGWTMDPECAHVRVIP